MQFDWPGDEHGALIWTIIGLAILAVHFAPTFIAMAKSHANSGAIFGLNILFGWTGIGWLALLVWSLSGKA